MGFIIHNGDSKDIDGDRFVNPQQSPRRSGSTRPTNDLHESLAAARGLVRIHYHRDDGDYGTPSADYTTFWGLHLWGDAIADGEGTEWTAPKPPTGADDFGVFWDVALKTRRRP